MADGEHNAWPKHSSYQYHRVDELQTTLCYLTLPGRTFNEKKYLTSEMEDECDFIGLHAAQAMDVWLPDIADGDKTRTRFQRALRLLGLQSYVHPSQSQLAVAPQKKRDGKSKQERAVAAPAKSLARGRCKLHPPYVRHFGLLTV